MPGMYATIGEILSYEGEVGNICDTFAVAIKKDSKVVAYVSANVLKEKILGQKILVNHL